MTMNINLKLYFLLLTIFLIFNLSCEDADYPDIFQDDHTYTILLNTSVSDGSDIDYNDGGVSEHTIITAILSQIDSNGSSSLKSDAQIDFTATFGDLDDPSNSPYLNGEDDNPTNTGITNAQGQVILLWSDAGYVGEIEIDCEYIDINGYAWTPIEPKTFTVHSIYEKVNDIHITGDLTFELPLEDNNEQNLEVRVYDESLLNGTSKLIKKN